MYQLHNEDYLTGITKIADNSIDLIIADPPYGLGKDYGNDSDKKNNNELQAWTEQWLLLSLPKLKPTGSLYIFTTWQHAPEIFSFLKQHLLMINEIIWDRRVPSMGGTIRKYSSVHDNIGFFVKNKHDYYFDLDAIRIPYDAKTKKARSRALFVGEKWLELGYNPKDIWSISRLHRIHAERENHPTQKPLALIERMIKASCPENGLVLDPFAGSGTTLEAAYRHNRNSIAYEINPNYCTIIEDRMRRIMNCEL
ncbi:MAG: site-specific DNA-methyltransferase [Methylococcaceae bacterium]